MYHWTMPAPAVSFVESLDINPDAYVERCLRVDDITLARILLKGMETVIHDENNIDRECFDPEDMRDKRMDFCARIIIIR